MKKTTITTLLCEKCKKNEVQIYNDCCNCCVPTLQCYGIPAFRLKSRGFVYFAGWKNHICWILGEGK